MFYLKLKITGNKFWASLTDYSEIIALINYEITSNYVRSVTILTKKERRLKKNPFKTIHLRFNDLNNRIL